MADLRNEKVAIVTGSADGIGREIALRLAADGARIVVHCLSDADAGNEVVSTIRARGGSAVLVAGDVAEKANMQALFETAEREFGGIDIFVHNATTMADGAISDATDDDFERLFALHSRATFVGFREAARRMRDNGRLIFMSSGLTVYGGLPGQGLYTASKAAGEYLVRPFAQELGARNITVNAVLVGMTRTHNVDELTDQELDRIAAMTPLRRLGQPDDIANAVGFLASDMGRWITGQCLQADGGIITSPVMMRLLAPAAA